MDEYTFIDQAKLLFCFSIASRLAISKARYDTSIETQNAISRSLTNVMSLGYNNCNVSAVIEELCMARHYGEENDPAVIQALLAEIAETAQVLCAELAAFCIMHRMMQDGAKPEKIWAFILEALEIDKAFRGNIPQPVFD